MKSTLHSLRSRRAFTLIELLVVIVILGILMAIALPQFLGQQHKAQDAKAKEYLAIAYREAKSASVGNAGGGWTDASHNASALLSQMAASEPGYSFVISAQPPAVTTTDGKPNVSVDVSGTNLVLTSRSDSGATCSMTAPENGAVPAPTCVMGVRSDVSGSTTIALADQTMEGVYSPNGATIAFGDYAAGSWSVDTVAADISNHQTLATGFSGPPVTSLRPVWHGSTIYLADGGSNIVKIPAGGGSATTITSGTYGWSLAPDGASLVVGRHADFYGDANLYAYDTSNSAQSTLYTKSYGGGASGSNIHSLRMPSFSPNGNYIVFFQYNDASGHFDLVRIDSDGSNLVTLVSDAFNAIPTENVAFSPNSATVYFISDVSGQKDIYSVPAGGGATTQRTSDAAAERSLFVSPDGKELLYATTGPSQLVRLSTVPGSTPVVITSEGGGGQYYPYGYSPNGANILYGNHAAGMLYGQLTVMPAPAR